MTRTTFSRLTAATALGAAVTAGVLLLMQSLIESDRSAVDDPPPGATLAILPKIEEKPPTTRDPKVKPPPDPVIPPPPPTVVSDDVGGPTIGARFGPPPLENPTGPSALRGLAEGDALPVVKVSPVYPARAQERGIEGYVLVQFTIDALGRVLNVQVIESEPRGVFDRAALKAVERFRYKPRVVNGEAIPVSGVQHLVTFELSS